MTRKTLHIGFDDIDSPRGRCTTHFGSIIVEKLDALEVEWLDYPNLIRLNPNIPYRTRGNGSIALRFKTEEKHIDSIQNILQKAIEEYIDEEYLNTNPGIVLVKGEVPSMLVALSKRALWRVIPITFVRRLIEELEVDVHAYGNKRGLIGALSAIGNQLFDDYTYEFIAYRSQEDHSRDRGVEPKSVRKMDKKMDNTVFSNIDRRTGRVLIAPHGPDPVVYGVRGENAVDTVTAGKMVQSTPNRERWLLFRTNQGTGEHLQHRVEIENLRPYMAATVFCEVKSKPEMIEGGHAIFQVSDATGTIDCAAYEPTGDFRKTVLKLIPGDKLILHSGIRPASRTHGMTVNVEGMEVIELAEKAKYHNPICPECSRRMTSAGRNKGYKCKNCGFRARDGKKIKEVIPRELSKKLYLPPLRAQRHLTRPHARVGKQNSGRPSELIKKWHMP
ncbi:MAG: DUF1743 domain-containing protein [Candidatus Lokiarchaeota archaeon]|nr:DUF1743 domain-containing protein [Candidatus Lokiarchaeota archaeon]